MTRSILSFFFLLGLLGLLAQPAGDEFPDFTFSDVEGNQHHLQSYLDDGKIVVIDVFATWCGNCQNSVPGLEELYNTLGQGGDGSMVVLSFERDPDTSDEAEYIEEFQVESPVITEATQLIADEWNITYQPRYFVICPDGTFQSELVTPIYDDPQPLIDLSEECAIATGIGSTNMADRFKVINTSVEDQLYYSAQGDQFQYRILDVTGSLSMSGRLMDGKGQLSLGSIPNGIYLLHVTDGQQAITKRIVKRS